VTQPNPIAYQIRRKFGNRAYLAIELERGEKAADVARKLRELAAEIEARPHSSLGRMPPPEFAARRGLE
jgi:hypothetical protein